MTLRRAKFGGKTIVDGALRCYLEQTIRIRVQGPSLSRHVSPIHCGWDFKIKVPSWFSPLHTAIHTSWRRGGWYLTYHPRDESKEEGIALIL
jgi:hypothetical protein